MALLWFLVALQRYFLAKGLVKYYTVFFVCLPNYFYEENNSFLRLKFWK